jgi:thymidylate synthase ThyX
MRSRKINVELILATAPDKYLVYKELYTFQVDLPYYVWVELLTHKRFARNASSNRAMSVTKNIEELGYYIPDTFYLKGKGMKAGEPVDLFSELDHQCSTIWKSVWEFASKAAIELETLGITKEQASRVLPTFKMMRGLVTGTRDAFEKFLFLRDNVNADMAMQELAKQIEKKLRTAKCDISTNHIPFLGDLEITSHNLMICAGRIARISYGKNEAKENDYELGMRLLVSGHLSPFEHMAFWETKSLSSCISSKEEDIHRVNKEVWEGWMNTRAMIEVNKDHQLVLGSSYAKAQVS